MIEVMQHENIDHSRENSESGRGGWEKEERVAAKYASPCHCP